MLKTLRFVFVVSVLLFVHQMVFAAIEPYKNFLKGSIKVGDSLLVKDEKFKNPTFKWSDITNLSVKNDISLQILDEQPISNSFSVKLRFRVEYFSSPEQIEPTKIDSALLNVNYNKETGAIYRGLDTYSFSGAFYVKIYVIGINSPEYGDHIPAILQLTSQINIDRTYLFRPFLFLGINGETTKPAGKALQRLTSGTPNATNNQLALSWALVQDAQEYDIEWVPIDADGEFGAMARALKDGTGGYLDEQVPEMFRNNATRITTDKQNATISLIYNTDLIAVRMRQVSYLANGLRNEGEWFYKKTDNNQYAIWELTWHEQKLNWQYSASYAEEGKKKEVINYFDGTLRNRQTATVNNSDNIAVVQENIYDGFGRPAASILPAPVKDENITEQSLHYFPSFNRNINNATYSFTDLNNQFCGVLPTALSSDYGASKYFSASNRFLNLEPYKTRKSIAYVPNADGYPLSVTRYTEDNTGRIKLQGGVGLTFQPGQVQDHTTHYFYDKPSQWELDRVFGNDVGYAEHYLKNTVVDPNGQISISYLNASGNTIATALAGDKPQNLNALDNKTESVTTEAQLLNNSQFRFDATTLSLTATATYTPSVTGPAVLKYDIEKLISRYPGGAFQPCNTCYYQLSIKVTDDCGQPVNTNATDRTIGSFKFDDCTYNEPPFDPVTLNFEKIGEYNISFTFKLKTDVIRDFTDEYVKKGLLNGTLNTRQKFVLDKLHDLNFNDCFSDCKTARENLGTRENFTTMFSNHIVSLGDDMPAAYAQYIDGLYTTISSSIDQIVGNCANTVSSPCDTYRVAMRADVSPGGQYAPLDANGNLSEPLINVLLLNFHTGAFVPLGSGEELYKKTAITRPDGTITSPYDSNFTFQELVTYWQPEWAEQFINFHPEYCKLEFCELNSAVKLWDKQLSDKTAAQIGYNYANPSNWLLVNDPYFTNGGAGATFYSDMAQDLAAYSVRISGLTSYATKNLSQVIDYNLYCADRTGNTNTSPNQDYWTNCSPNNDCRLAEREWTTYIGHYLDLKEKYYILKRQQTTCQYACSVGTPISVLPAENCQSRTMTVETVQYSATNYRSFNYSLNQQNTFYYVPGTITSPPAVSSYCSQGTAEIKFYSCLDVKFNGATNKMNNVWEIICTEDIPETCQFAEELFTNGRSGTNQFSYQDNYSRYDYTLIEGFAANEQPSAYCNGTLNNNVTFKPCYTVYFNSQVINYSNVWVAVCYTNLGGQGPGGPGNPCPEQPQPTYLRVVENNIDPALVQPCEVMVQMKAFNTSEQSIEADLNTNTIYAVSKTAPINEKTASKERNTFKRRFGGFVKKKYFALKNGESSYKIFRNVWVAEFVPDSNSVNWKRKRIKNRISQMKAGKQLADSTTNISARSASVQSASLNNSVTSPCPNSDFTVFVYEDYNPTYGANGVTYFVSANRTNNCDQDVYVDIYTASHYFETSVLVPAHSNYADLFVPYAHMPSNAGYYACGTLCNGTGPNPGCTTSYAGKSTRFPEANFNLPTLNGSQANQQQEQAAMALIADNCSAGAEQWVQKLSDGLEKLKAERGWSDATMANYKQQLRLNLANLCSLGGDQTHPFGASTLKTGVGSLLINGTPCRSFGDVIKATLSITAFTNELNPWILDGAYPYETPQQATDVYISATSDEICNKLQGMVPDINNPVSAYNQLKSVYGNTMQLTLAELTALMKGCTQCRHLLEFDIKLPVFLQNTGGCISNTQYGTLLNSMATDFGSNPDPNWSNYPIIFANYFNFKTGFALTYDQYIAFANSGKPQLCNEVPFTTVTEDPYVCVKSLIDIAYGTGDREYLNYIAVEREKFVNAYVNTCAAAKANVKLSASQQIYHYTLYYYDLAGNLVRTVPPEGVSVLGKTEIDQVGLNRAGLLNDNCTYNGPDDAANETTAFQSLSNVLQNGGNNAVELWLYASAAGARQFIAATPDMKYMMQVCQNGNLLSVDIYSLNQTAPDNVSIILSNHVTANIQDIMPLQPWTHIVVQGTDLARGSLQIWINGKPYAPVLGAPAAGCGWAISGTNPVTMPRNLSLLKQLRLYQGRILDPIEIAFNAASKCMEAKNSPWPLWYRFNVPLAGSNTTIAANSKTETQFKGIFPAHTLTTTYTYNATDQVVQQLTPDAGLSKFWYDRISRLVLSRNAKQELEGDYSYTKYESVLGRITEVGRKRTGASLPEPGYLTSNQLSSFMSSGQDYETTQTKYDEAVAGAPSNVNQQNLRKRVSASLYRENPQSSVLNASYYSYDLSGNVKRLYQQVDGLNEVKRLDYEYDLVSGKVNFLAYQHNDVGSPAKPDRFYYQYEYDAENRLLNAWSAVNAGVSTLGFGSKLTDPDRRLDAHYEYYLHGPLARIVLGKQEFEVQGMDYAYTLQGWLKGVNGSSLSTDIGSDGAHVAKDVLAYSLGYFNGDYSPIGGGTAFNLNHQGNNNSEGGRSLFNGNISSSTYHIAKLGDGNPVGYTYGYDQLNRINNFRQQSITANNWGQDLNSWKYYEEFVYDANGNIKKLKRRNGDGALMDNLSYSYNTNAGKLINNKLNAVDDAAGGTVGTPNLASSSYGYDAIGNLITETEANQTKTINWTLYGKIKSITGPTNITYSYDASGNRVKKTIGNTSTFYVRDAQGNNLAIYERTGNEIKWTEQQLYGSSHLGMWRPNVNLASASGASAWNTSGLKFFELSNHLGNVMAVINDNPDPATNPIGATVINANDYYAFGGQMNGRDFTNPGAQAYRYGFNGKENDNEVKGAGNQQDYGMRIYDPRIGKFLSVDPLRGRYPELTPYQFASNTPIGAIDIDGGESGIPINGVGISGTPLSNYFLDKQGRENWAKSMGIGIGIPAVIVTDIYVTKGRLSQFLLGSQFLSAFNHNQAKTAEGRIQQEKDSRNAISEAAFTYATGITIGKIFGAVTNTIARKSFNPDLLKFHDGAEMTNVYYNNKHIGGYTSNGTDGVTMGLNIPAEFQGKGIGSEVFKRAIKEEFANKFTAIWVESSMYQNGSSVNLQRYLEAAKKMSPEAAAFETWSGGQAKALGFTNVKVEKIENGVKAVFTKP